MAFADPPDPALLERATALREEGRVAEAAQLIADRIARGDFDARLLNCAVEMHVSAGRYRDAQRAAVLVRGRDWTRAERALIAINAAEADYNLGHWGGALCRLWELDADCETAAITLAGLRLQRAWIAAHFGRGPEALAYAEAVDVAWLPQLYQAELYFTRAAALLARGRVDDAFAALDEGERRALRLSSHRNALFLRARLESARGRWAEAEALCRTAADHLFKGQGGDGLLLWATALERLGRPDESRKALLLAVERDPESGAARLARVRLARSPAG
jgi:tetratricopeptide (TPR) repeat protein